MKLYTSGLCAAILAGVLLTGSALSQVKRSPVYGISYDAQGFDTASDAYIDKRARKIERRHGAGAAADFRFQMMRMRRFGEWLDRKWAERVEAWSRCYRVGHLDPRRLFVTVEDSTFTLPQYPELRYIWGTVDPASGRVRVTAWAMIPNRGWMVNGVDTWGWEAGNWIQTQVLGLPGSVSKEYGDSDPCNR